MITIFGTVFSDDAEFIGDLIHTHVPVAYQFQKLLYNNINNNKQDLR